MRNHVYHTYILMNQSDSVLYVGMTNDIARRMAEHKTGEVPGFTQRYKLTKLVWLEAFKDVKQAIGREKQLKNWRRDWKLNLIRDSNPELADLSATWLNA